MTLRPSGDHPTSDERIIRATLDLIASDGLGSVTMRRIAEEAQVARQTLYNHYSDVDSIVAEAISRHSAESIDLLETTLAVVDSPDGKLRQLVRHTVAVGAHAGHVAGFRQGLSAAARSGLMSYDDALDRCIRDVLESGQQCGLFREDLETEVDVAIVRHMLDGLAVESASRPEDAAVIAAAGERTVIAAVSNAH